MMRPALRLWLAALALFAAPAQAITVSKVISNAKSFANHKWTATSANAKASCYPAYVSPFLTKYGLGAHVGLPYNYANWVTLAQFDDQIAKGYGAGSQTSFGVLSCTTGHDCSGFISRCWEHPKRYTTHYMHQISKEIPATSIAQADIYNYPGKHAVLWDGVASNGAPRFYEAAGGVWKVWYATTKSWSYLSGYVARRYNNIEGSSGGGGVPPATPVIIPVKSFPFSHSANTVTMGAALWSNYGAACPPPSGGELGPEIVYALDIPADGTLKAELSDGVGVDLDLHLLTALDPKSCIARHDTTIGPLAVQAGKRYIVADTWSSTAGVPKPGPYTITITFTSSCAPKAEVCNGQDDDCDGDVDEGALCDDGLPCTDDVCAPSGVCEAEPNANGCFIGGACVSAGAAQPGVACVVCDVLAPTVWSPANGTACADDGNPCTHDACEAGICAHPPADGKACDDAAPCTASAGCQGGSCVAGAPVQCGPSSGPCSTMACDASTGLCVELPLPPGTPCAAASCTDGKATPTALCDGAGACKAGASSSCGAYACAANGACGSDCASHADCAPQATCVAQVCVVDGGGDGSGGGGDGDAASATDAATADDGTEFADGAAGNPDGAAAAGDGGSGSDGDGAGGAPLPADTTADGLPMARDAAADANAPAWAPPQAGPSGCAAAGGGQAPGSWTVLALALGLLGSARWRRRVQGDGPCRSAGWV